MFVDEPACRICIGNPFSSNPRPTPSTNWLGGIFRQGVEAARLDSLIVETPNYIMEVGTSGILSVLTK